jgi:hypothetical protein
VTLQGIRQQRRQQARERGKVEREGFPYVTSAMVQCLGGVGVVGLRPTRFGLGLGEREGPEKSKRGGCGPGGCRVDG